MAFMTYCTNKGCGKQMEPYIDPKDDKVYCSDCDRELPTITHFTKVQMKSFRQFKQKKSITIWKQIRKNCLNVSTKADRIL